MKWRRVATGFIEVIKEEKSHILLFKRSEKVNSYPKMWASISGSIDLVNNPPVDYSSNDRFDYRVGDYFVESPMECAFREIQEETQLQVGKHLNFIRSGRPQYLPLNNGKGFIVYPFLFRLSVENSKDIPSQLDNLGFKIDWEHDSFNVFDTEQFLRKGMNDSTTPTLHETVPNLRDTLHRLYFFYGLETELLVEIDNTIVNNFTDGATTIALKTIDIMKKALNLFSSEDIPDYFKLMNSSIDMDSMRAVFLTSKLRDIVWILDQCRIEMPMIRNVAVQSLVEIMNGELQFDQDSIVKQISEQTFENMVQKMKDRLNKFGIKISNNTQLLSNKFQNYVKSEFLKDNTQKISILTHSWSSVVIKSLKDLMLDLHAKHASIDLTIYCTESQPEKEGYKTAKSLKDFALDQGIKNLRVQVCTEASVGLLSRSGKVDLMCVGSDSIHSSHGDIVISNKTGTSVLYSISRFYNIPFVVLSDTMKISQENSDTFNTEMDDSILLKQPLFEHFTLMNDSTQTKVLLDQNTDLNHIQSQLEIQRLKIFGK